MLLLGMVREVRESEALISLPNDLTGWVEVDQISDELNAVIEAALDDDDTEAPALSDFLHLGQTVRCVVAATSSVMGGDKKMHKHVSLSLKPSMVNLALSAAAVHPGMVLYGAISSVEDRGYQVSFGTRALSGFLPSTAAPPGGPLRVGQVLELMVDKVDAARRAVVLTLRALVLVDLRRLPCLTVLRWLVRLLVALRECPCESSAARLRVMPRAVGSPTWANMPTAAR